MKEITDKDRLINYVAFQVEQLRDDDVLEYMADHFPKSVQKHYNNQLKILFNEYKMLTGEKYYCCK